MYNIDVPDILQLIILEVFPMKQGFTQSSNLYEHIEHLTENRPFSIHYTELATDISCALYLHWHAEYELFYMQSGTVTFHANNEIITLHSGDALLIPPYVLHSAEKQIGEDCAHYAFVFSPNYLTDSVSDARYSIYLYSLQALKASSYILIRGIEPWQQHFFTSLNSIFSCYQKPLNEYELFIHGHFLLLWQELVNHCGTHTLEHFSPKRSSQLEPALQYIHTHFHETISLEQLASTVYLSKEQFCRSFKKLTGVSAFFYLNRYRIQRSCEYLIDSDKKIADIAFLCGFSNISYYNREFKKYIHMSPKAYRLQINGA